MEILTVDCDMLSRCLVLAERGGQAVWPNPLVGAIVVRDGTIVGRGYHRIYGGLHAEAIALEGAGRLAEGSTLYCNLEPCCYRSPEKHQPPCTEHIIRRGVRRVIIGQLDPNPRVCGQGVQLLRDAGVVVTLSADPKLNSQIRQLNWRFNRRFPRSVEQGW